MVLAPGDGARAARARWVLSGAQLKLQSSYVGWSFGEHWENGFKALPIPFTRVRIPMSLGLGQRARPRNAEFAMALCRLKRPRTRHEPATSSAQHPLITPQRPRGARAITSVRTSRELRDVARRVAPANQNPRLGFGASGRSARVRSRSPQLRLPARAAMTSAVPRAGAASSKPRRTSGWMTVIGSLETHLSLQRGSAFVLRGGALRG